MLLKRYIIMPIVLEYIHLKNSKIYDPEIFWEHPNQTIPVFSMHKRAKLMIKFMGLKMTTPLPLGLICYGQ